LSALPFDTRRLAAAGEAVPIAQQVISRSPVAFPLFSASAKQGLLAYVTGARAGAQYVWRDRQGRYLGAAGAAANVVNLSPDGTRLVGDFDGTHILDLASGISTDLLAGRGNRNPIWSPDGKYIAVNYGRLGWGVYRKPSSGAGDWEPLTLTDRLTAPLSWSPDGRFLMYAQLNPDTAADLLALPMDGERKPFVVVRTPANENQGQFSPDGHWVAYTSNESGLSEIYVIPFPPSPDGGRWLVSKGGGVMPRWRRDGKELFYISPNSQMMAVDVAASQVFKSGNPHPLFQTDIVDTGIRTGPMSWDIAPDGRFLIISETSTDASINVVLNWRAAEPN
jgi:Tol biopolymer transport system component